MVLCYGSSGRLEHHHSTHFPSSPTKISLKSISLSTAWCPGYAYCLDLLNSQGEQSKVYQEETKTGVAVAIHRKHASQGRGASVSQLECAYLKALLCVEQVGSGFCAKVSYPYSHLV